MVAAVPTLVAPKDANPVARHISRMNRAASVNVKPQLRGPTSHWNTFEDRDSRLVIIPVITHGRAELTTPD